MSASARPARAAVIAAFAAIYLIWGSTYFAIRVAIETLPPFAMAATRFLLAGGALYAWLRLRGVPRPTLVHWRSATVVGALLLLLGNGTVVWAEQRVPSGLAAILITMTPACMALLEWLKPGGRRPDRRATVGLLGGLVGVALLLGPDRTLGGGRIDPIGAAALLLASLSWAAGSLWSREAPLPPSPFLATAMEMLAGGALLAVVALARSEWGGIDWAAVSLRSVIALGYLAVLGSLVALSAYIWLLRVTTPARVATHAYVNPVVAVLLGWLFGGETLSARTWLATLLVVGSVALVTLPARGTAEVERRAA